MDRGRGIGAEIELGLWSDREARHPCLACPRGECGLWHVWSVAPPAMLVVVDAGMAGDVCSVQLNGDRSGLSCRG